MFAVGRVGDWVDEEAYGGNDGYGSDASYDHKGGSGDLFVCSVRKGDVGVDEGEGTVVGRDSGEEEAGDCDETVSKSVFEKNPKEIVWRDNLHDNQPVKGIRENKRRRNGTWSTQPRSGHLLRVGARRRVKLSMR